MREIGRTLPEFQAFHRELDAIKEFDTDFLTNMVLLTEEVGELAREIFRVRRFSTEFAKECPPEEAYARALEIQSRKIGAELADCLAYLLKLSNYAGIDLETAYLAKMNRNVERVWPEAKKMIEEVAAES